MAPPLSEAIPQSFCRPHASSAPPMSLSSCFMSKGSQKRGPKHFDEFGIGGLNGSRSRNEYNPSRRPRRGAIPGIESVGALADWLGVTVGELEWFADVKKTSGTSDPAQSGALSLQNFGERSAGNIRLIEAP